jgi:ABC-type transport system substrate-binding protein
MTDHPYLSPVPPLVTPSRMEKTMKRTRIVPALTAMALTATLAACSSSPEKGSSGAASGAAPADVTVGIRSDIDTFDPHKTQGDFGAQQMARLAYS